MEKDTDKKVQETEEKNNDNINEPADEKQTSKSRGIEL